MPVLARLAERFDRASTGYGMEISSEKTKPMTNNASGINTEIKVNGQKLETITSFKYLGSFITYEVSKIQHVIGPTRKPLDHCKETQSAVVWNFSRSSGPNDPRG